MLTRAYHALLAQLFIFPCVDIGRIVERMNECDSDSDAMDGERKG